MRFATIASLLTVIGVTAHTSAQTSAPEKSRVGTGVDQSVDAALADDSGRFWYRGMTPSPAISSTGSSAWVVQSIEALTRPVADFDGAFGLALQFQDMSNHYLFLCSFRSAAAMIYKRVDGTYTLLNSAPLSVQVGNEYLLRAETDGAGALSLYINGRLEVSAFDTTFSSGLVGLRVWNGIVDFDDVVVQEPGGGILLFDDFEDGVADGWSGGSDWSVVDPSAVGGMPTPQFDTNFEGGNIQVDLIDPPTWTIHAQPELKGTSPYRAWYYFKMSNLSAAQPTNIVVGNVRWSAVPFYSYDNEVWTRFARSSGNWHSQTFTSDPVWVAYAIPYVTKHKQQLIDDLEGTFVRTNVLATSESGRPVEVLTITDPQAPGPKQGIWFVARNHAWETPGSWMADRLARWLVSNDPQAASLRRKAVVHVVPIMDIDNVVLGGSGKDQQPIDFNRDWRADPHWNAVSAAIRTIDDLAAVNPYAFFIDSHSAGTHQPFLAVQPESMVTPAYWARFLDFREILISTAGGPLPYSGSYSEWGPSYHPLWDQMSFWHQFLNHPQLSLSLTLETPSASLAGYDGLATGIGRALEMFLPPLLCYADCDPSTGQGVLDVFDFLCFQNSFINGETYACDCDTTTGNGVCDVFDFLCFQNAFVTGCP